MNENVSGAGREGQQSGTVLNVDHPNYLISVNLSHFNGAVRQSNVRELTELSENIIIKVFQK